MTRLNKQLSLRFIILCTLFLVSFVLFFGIANQAVFEKETGFDEAVTAFRVKYVGQGLINFMESITFFGSSMFLLPAYGMLLLYFIFRKQYLFALLIGFMGAATTGLMFLLKRVFRRDRPQDQLIEKLTNYSFPSGHAFSSFIFCSILSYIIWKTKWKPLFKWMLISLLILFSITIGISRIVLNVHYATDVIAGFCLAVMWIILFFATFKKHI